MKNKHELWFALLFSLLTSGTAISAQNDNVAVVQAAESIERLSQKIAKAYFYRQQGVRISHAKKELKEGIADLDGEIKRLSVASIDEEERNVLMFIAFTRDEMKEILAKPYTEENGALMLDFSDSFLEGAELIAGKHLNRNDAKEKMLVAVERNLFLLERITKYYIAFRAGFRDFNNVTQLKRAIKEFEENLGKINGYKGYPKRLTPTVEKINKFWPIARRFYLGIEKGALPVIVLASTDNLIKDLRKLESYHLKMLKKGK